MKETATPQVSTVSFATTKANRKRSRLWLAFAALLVAGGAAIALLTFDREKPAPEPQHKEVMQPAIEAPVPSVSAAPSVSITASAPPSVVEKPVPKTIHKPVAPPKPPPGAPSCTVKSFVDGAGVKHYFNDCPKK